jgi:hypothetical protein
MKPYASAALRRLKAPLGQLAVFPLNAMMYAKGRGLIAQPTALRGRERIAFAKRLRMPLKRLLGTFHVAKATGSAAPRLRRNALVHAEPRRRGGL